MLFLIENTEANVQSQHFIDIEDRASVEIKFAQAVRENTLPINPKSEQSIFDNNKFISKSQTVEATTTLAQWGEFSGGCFLGVSVALSTQVDNVCLKNIATLTESGYLIYYYMARYYTTQSTDDASYAFAYILKLFRTGMTFDCTGGISFASRDSFNTKKNIQQKANHSKFSIVKAESDASDLIGLLIQVLGDVQEAMGLLEIFIDSQTIYSEWQDGDYFEAGLYTGKGVTNAAYTFYGIIQRVIKNYT
ncbi:UNKNOWN [Stylonychia lemnae]|uniref:Uncharacterized protein n=1 Tax=Stylonychia lemnae TaxID=5949 RepID=A0A078AUA8_STYLE|nr:UNKNOWN [Stylonychia lemnae]|eukprot:CDW85990.1 UNKNOWN [Stylonychia lemnae]